MSRFVVEGQLVDSLLGSQWGQIEIVDGTIQRVGDLGLKADLVASQEQLVFPGFVDVHVHLRQGHEYKEDFQSGCRAALHGGVTAMIDMPNNPIPPKTLADLALKRSLVEDLPIDIDFYLGVGPGSTPDPSGPAHYKAYMGPSIGPLYFHSDEDLEEALQRFKGHRIAFHCEDPVMLRQLEKEALHESQRPVEAEWKAVETALRLGQKHGFGVHVAHMTSERSLELVEKARPAMLAATTEASPHHLFFDWENRSQFRRSSWLKMNPPLRSGHERRALLQAMLAGRIDFLATDHAPHTCQEKASDNPSGVPLLDTYGGFVTWLMQQGWTPAQVARHCCHLPGEFSGRKLGRLQPGYRGHLTILSPQDPWTVEAEDLQTRCGWSPFEGVTLPGRVAWTVASGRLFRKGLEVT